MSGRSPALEFLKKHIFFLLGGACIVIVGIIFIVTRGAEPEITRNEENILGAAESGIENPAAERAAIPEETPEPRYIMVYITGEVHSPGAFTLREGARVLDVLELAGGLTEYADARRINPVDFLVDALKIIVPAEGEDVEEVFVFGSGGGRAAASGITVAGLVNINTASFEELQTLTGVGSVIAQNIIDFREAHGGFSSVDELIHVSRIGAVTLENLRPHVTVD